METIKNEFHVGHEMCDFLGDGCKTSENGWCFCAERKEE